MPNHHPTLAVLAGGRGQRMGRPKGTLTIAGVPILPHLLDRLRWPGPTLLVTAPGRERPPGHDRFDAEAVDPTADQGPLRGVLTALETSTTPVVVITTVDMPGVTGRQLVWLADQLADDDAGVLLDRDGRTESFPLALRTTIGDRIVARLNGGRRSVHALTDKSNVRVVPAPADWPAETWANLNTPAEWAAFSARRDLV